MPTNDPKVKILEVKDNSFDIYELLSRRDRATINEIILETIASKGCLLYTSPSPRDATLSRMPSSA